jgi:hypothetical protein
MRLFQVASTWAVAAVLYTACDVVNGSSSDHRYKQGEHVELWVNKVRWIRYVAGSTGDTARSFWQVSQQNN